MKKYNFITLIVFSAFVTYTLPGCTGDHVKHAHRAGSAGIPENLNVYDFGAVGDSTTDDTKAFQAALDQAGKKGEVVVVPAGKYRFDGSLNVPDGVTLKGTWEGPHLPDVNKGSVLLVFGGRDKEKGSPFITQQANSTVKGLTIWYPEQRLSDVHPYPYTIFGNGFRVNVIDCAIANTYNGIDFGSGELSLGIHLRNIDMCALRRGVYIDRCYDISRVENVHIHPVSWVPVEKGENLNKYLMENCEGFIIGKTDWLYMVDCFTICNKIGFHFIETEQPIPVNGIVPQSNAMILQSGSDLGLCAVRVEKSQYHAGITFMNTQFYAGIEIGPKNDGPVKFTNCSFYGVSRTGHMLVNEGAGAVFFTACHFSTFEDPYWRKEMRFDPKKPFLQVLNGTLHLSSCRFQDLDFMVMGYPKFTPEFHIFLGEKVKSAAIIGNSVDGGKLRIRNLSKGDVQILGNVGNHRTISKDDVQVLWKEPR